MSASSKPPRAPRRQVVSTDDRVRVIVRVRPSLHLTNKKPAAFPFDTSKSTCDGDLFDAVLGPDATQDLAFKQVIPVVETWLNGYNATIFAYGQTGSGKSHTMLGPNGGKEELTGVIPQVVSFALKRLDQEKRDRLAAGGTNVIWNARLQASYVELYNEQLRDLIRNDDDVANVDRDAPQVREDANHNVFLSGATKTTVQSPEELLRLVRLGARRRAMGRTNMNEFSSRSHAVLSLYLECRWKDTTTSEGMIKSSVSVLQLVDLAGSEYAKKTGNEGLRMQESIAINTGLFTLGCVIAALSGHRDRRVGNHIPYRDSLLTRLLQSALGGDARTALVVCVSPDPENLVESRSSLVYASSARKITNVSKQHIEEQKEEIQGPYQLPGDIADPVAEADRRVVYVDTEFGEVFCRVLGDLQDDLFLFVHGSGPENSSAYFNSLIWELYSRMPNRKICYVSIDCPGYGRSIGDRQVIRSNPGELIAAVVHGLGKRDLICLLGSSQGCASSFNAILQYPRLARRMVGMHPVGHDPSRYTTIKIPVLLTFDVEDAGHPVSVGRIMKRNLPFCLYHEYYCSKTPYWESENTATEIIKLLDWQPEGAVSIRSPFANQKSVNAQRLELAAKNSWTLAGGVCSWVESNGRGQECNDLCYLKKPSTFLAKQLLEENGNDDALTITSSASDAITFKSDTTDSFWNAYIDEKTQRVYYVNSKTKETKFKRPENGRIVNVSSSSLSKKSNNDNNNDDDNDDAVIDITQKEAEKLFEDDYQDSDDDFEEDEETLNARVSAEIQETKCSCCGNLLWKPDRHRQCRHVVCNWCKVAISNIQKSCATCKKTTFESVGEDMIKKHQELLEKIPSCISHGKIVDAAVAFRQSLPSITLEYGNTAEGTSGSSFSVCASIKAVKTTRGSPKVNSACGSLGNLSANSVISKIGFDINPHYPKSAVKCTSPPFKLDRDMSTAFTCAMQVSFGVPALSWLTLVIPYGIHHVPDYRERVVVYLVPQVMAEKTDKNLFYSQPPPSPSPASAAGNDSNDGDAAPPFPRPPIAVIDQNERKGSTVVSKREGVKMTLPNGWYRLPDIDYDECAVNECFVILKNVSSK